ncbi:hypothetical protein FACS1894147_12160 [Spirochaetia bacterium]|nr:hypothetical protein FACS1894147_12160 [Spirochaetia bacterium]
MRGRSVYSGKPVEIAWEQGRITQAEERGEPASGSGEEDLPWVSAGFVDIQVNGFLGSEYAMKSLVEEHVAAITGRLARSGTTRHIPTIITSPRELILRNLKVIAEAREKDEDLRDAIPGIHIEGPFISGNNDSRQLIHITYGLILGKFKDTLYQIWRRREDMYAEALERHIGKHLDLLGVPK